VVDVRLEVFHHTASLATPIEASQQRHETRSYLYAALTLEGVTGWGEVSPQPFPLNGDPGVDDVITEINEQLLPLFQSVITREGALPQWSRLAQFTSATPASRVATTLLEMAALDWSLRREGRSLDSLWPAQFETPLLRTASAYSSDWTTFDGANHLRLKIAHDPIPVETLEALTTLAIDVVLDYNCAEPTRDTMAGHLRQLRDVTAVRAIEQPFAAGNLVDHALLRANVDVPISIDEGVRHRRDLDHIVQYEAADIVCIKPARVGGYSMARSLVTHALAKGLRPYIGGFFESPLARQVNRTLAYHHVVEPSDCAPPVFAAPGEWTTDGLGIGVFPHQSLQSRFDKLAHLDIAVG